MQGDNPSIKNVFKKVNNLNVGDSKEPLEPSYINTMTINWYIHF